ncbi:MAG: hypothetical protein E7360_02205 [Clostridiales bacterium]|nr:hypothetical protein [Clostridiales bacterium]
MSFFTNNASDRSPGRINGNPINGLCEKVCIEAQKVFDACIRQFQVDGVNIPLSNFVPENPALPLTFISARSTTSTGVVTDLQVDRLPDRQCFARVQATVTVPVEVLYTDANGVQGRADSTISFSQDIIMYIPEPSIIPFEVTAIVSVVAPEGVYVDGETPSFTVTGCATIITKIVMPVEILVPSYGYAVIPPCQEYTQEVCSGFFDLPIYPRNT